jgi:hypothetical protein
MTTECPTEGTLAKRVAYLKRIFARGVGRTPSAKQKLAVARAALLTAAAEAAALDPATTANDLVRLDGAASRARREMAAVLHAAKPSLPSLSQLMRARA